MAILEDFFHRGLSVFPQDDLLPAGRKIVECRLGGGTLSDDEGIPGLPLLEEARSRERRGRARVPFPAVDLRIENTGFRCRELALAEETSTDVAEFYGASELPTHSLEPAR